MLFYKDLVSIVPDYYINDIKGFTDYLSNKELSIFIIVLRIKKGIIKHIKEIEKYKINEKNPLIKLEMGMLKEAEIVKKCREGHFEECSPEEIELFKKRNNLIPENIDDFIKVLKDNIDTRAKIECDNFSIYFENLSYFLISVKTNFKKRFADIDHLENEEFFLFRDFCFFIEYYNFNYFNADFFIDKWNNTFFQPKEYVEKYIKENSIPGVKEYELQDNVLTIKMYYELRKQIHVMEIKNINNYCINCVINYFSDKYKKKVEKSSVQNNYNEWKIITIPISDFSIEHLLKFDSIQEIYINKMWNIFEEHLVKIFTSPLIVSVFEKINNQLGLKKYYNFLNKEDLILLFKRARIFQFKSDILGLTEPFFFIDFIYYRGMIERYFEECSKLLNLIFYQVTQQHELLGDLNIRLQNYFLKDKKEISSPPESGIFVEKIIYGQPKAKLNINEILFLLDEENYKVDLDAFQKNFKECRKGTYKISKSLEIFLNSLNITIYEDFIKLGEMSINEDLTRKILSDNDNFTIYYQVHTEFLHPPPKISDSVKKFLDNMYEGYYKKNNSNK